METDFHHNGIGILSGCRSCVVTEEANGLYELVMQYPIDGIHSDEIVDRSLIKAKPNRDSSPQLFRVYSITKPMNGILSVSAQHVSYDLSGIPVSVFSAQNAPDALLGLSNNAVTNCPFRFRTDKKTIANFSAAVPGSIRSKLGGVAGSILDVYGGEYEFDNFDVILHNRRGQNRGVSIRYGKNLKDMKQDINCASVSTGVYPYWVNAETGAVVELPERIVYADGLYDFEKIKMLDVTEVFMEKPTVDQIRNYAKSYIKNNSIGIPSVSLSVSFTQLEQSAEYKGKYLLDRVFLFDTVSVEFPALKVSASAKVVKIVYDVILDRVKNATLGNVRANIADTLAKQTQQIQRTPTKEYVQNVSAATSSVATDWLTNGMGYKVERIDENGNAYDTLYFGERGIDNAIRVLRIGKNGIESSRNGAHGQYYTLLSQDGVLQSEDGTISVDLFHNIVNIHGKRGEYKTVLSLNADGIVGYGENSVGEMEKVLTVNIGAGEYPTSFQNESVTENNGLCFGSESSATQVLGDEVYISSPSQKIIIAGKQISWYDNGDGTFTMQGT
jgi:phage minor structural protein